MEEKKILTAEEIMAKATELGYDVSIDDCEEAADAINNAPMTEEGEVGEELDEDALEDVAGGVNTASILLWIKVFGPRGRSRGKITILERAKIEAARKRFGRIGAALATAYYMKV